MGFLGGFLTHGSGGGMHYREMPNGQIVYTRRATASFLGSPLASSIAKFTPGDGAGNVIDGIGDPLNLEAPHALSPEPLPDGRIVFSYTPKARVWVDEKHRILADFDYGLYVGDSNFQNLKLVYDNPGTEELDPVAVCARNAKVIPDQIKSVPAAEPDHPIKGFAIFESRSIYADIDRRFTHVLSPLPGSVVAIDIYDDAQTFTTTAEFPLVRKQMPRFFKSFPVNPDGSFRAEIPADRPVLYFLRGPTGVAARYPGSCQSEIRTPMFGHEQLRPGEVIKCTGCHRGHMIRPELSRSARVNIARLAYAAGSSTTNSSYMAPARVLDGYIGEATGRYQWVPAPSDVWPWVRLSWEQKVTVREILIYPRPGVKDPIGEFEIYLSSGQRILGRSDPQKPAEPVSVSVPNPGPIRWVHLQLVGYPSGNAPGVAEIQVTGDPVQALSDSPPPAVPSAAITAGSLRLSWSRSSSPSVIGYKIFGGPSPDYLPYEWDVGNVTSYQPEYLPHHQKYYFQIRPYNASQFGPPQVVELSGSTTPPRIDGITPASGPWWGGAEVTIEGANFLPGLSVKIGGSYLSNVKVVSPTRITATTPRTSAGAYDLLVRNPGQMEATLWKAYRYQ